MAARAFKDESCAGLLADMAEMVGLQRTRLLLLVGDRLADAAEKLGDCATDAELMTNADDLANLWRHLRGTGGPDG